MKCLFIHNTIADYRIPFFLGLNKKINIEYIFTRKDLSKNIYGNDLNYEKVKELKYIFLPENIKKYKLLKESLASFEYDKVILPPIDTLRDYVDNIYILLLCKKYKKKTLYFGEKWEAPFEEQPLKKRIKNKLQAKAIKSILSKVDLCIASGSKSKEYLKNLSIKEDRIKIAIDASGVEKEEKVEDIRKKFNLNKDTKLILYYGRIIERKGLDILIKAYKEINSIDSNTCLFICGKGQDYEKQCKKMVEELGINNVIFNGYVDPKNRYTYFSQSDLFILPSYFYEGIVEAWGLTVNEALQCEVPVIATNAVGAAYDLLDGNNGKMISQNNILELVEAMKEFLYYKDINKVKKSCSDTYNKFDYDNMINKFVEFIYKC